MSIMLQTFGNDPINHLKLIKNDYKERKVKDVKLTKIKIKWLIVDSL